MVGLLTRVGSALVGSKWRFSVFAGLSAVILTNAAQEAITEKVFWKMVRKEIEEEEEILHLMTQQHVKETLETGKKKQTDKK